MRFSFPTKTPARALMAKRMKAMLEKPMSKMEMISLMGEQWVVLLKKFLNDDHPGLLVVLGTIGSILHRSRCNGPFALEPKAELLEVAAEVLEVDSSTLTPPAFGGQPRAQQLLQLQQPRLRPQEVEALQPPNT